MKRLSAKSTVYLIDGSNFSRSFWDRGQSGKTGTHESEFLGWLDDVSRLGLLSGSSFRVVFDGGCRPARGFSNPSISVHFSKHGTADDLLIERAYFLASEGARCAIVSSDRGIRERAAGEGVISLPCDVFYRLCEAELRKESG